MSTSDTLLSNAVLMRESARHSRRWQTYGARMGFSAIMMGLLLLGIWTVITVATEVGGVKATELSWLGRSLFVGFTILQTLLALIMAPMMVSRSIIEELSDKTMDLLVLTPIKVQHVLASKVFSQTLSILLIIIGALPVMAMVVSLGGVGIDELVVITVGMMVTVLLMGVLGAFFGMFTRSPVIAMLASLFWALTLLILMPMVHGLISGSVQVSAQVSPFFANVGNWWGLLIVLAYFPIIWLVYRLSARLFELKVSNAELVRYFDWNVWHGKQILWAMLAFLCFSIVAVPTAVTLSWISTAAFSGVAPTFADIVAQPVPALLGAAGRVLSLIWTVYLATLCTWLYLRLGMDVVEILDGVTSGMGRSRSRKKRSLGLRIWRNPVLWRESRLSGWGGGSLGLLIAWVGGLFVFFQVFGVALIAPGVMVVVGLINGLGAVALAMWMAAGSLEQERTRFTLTLLLMSDMGSWRVLLGKTLALTPPTLPFLLLGCLLLVVGHPVLSMWDVVTSKETFSMWTALARGGLSSVWLIPVWLVMVHISQLIGLRARRRSAIYTLSLACGALIIGVPAMMGWIFRDLWFLALPGRLIVPPLMLWAGIFELLISIGMWTMAAIALQALLVMNLRRWGGTVDG